MKLVFLGKLADLAGCDDRDVEGGAANWDAFRPMLAAEFGPDLASACDREEIRIAVDGVVLPDRAGFAAGAGSEVALLPPVSGG
jgi:molybdopterin converting factor small subunit